MKQIIFKNITLREMLENEVKVISKDDSAKDYTYYWKDDEGQLQKISEIDILRDRFCTVNGDFNYFENELEYCRIYIKEELEDEE